MPPVGKIALFCLLQETEGSGEPEAWQISFASSPSWTTTALKNDEMYNINLEINRKESWQNI